MLQMLKYSLLSLFIPLYFAQQDAYFLMNQMPFAISPSSRTFILGTNANSVDFQLEVGSVLEPSMRFQAELIGPSILAPRTVELAADQREWRLDPALFEEAGSYQLTHIRLVKEGLTVAYASPSLVEVKVLENILVTGVEVREIRQAELAQRGYVFNTNDYRVLDFQVSLITAGTPEFVSLPIALPRSRIWNLEPVILEDPLKPSVFAELLHFPVQDSLDDGGGGKAGDSRGSFYSLLLIPGELSYLKTHFNVTALVFNSAAPESELKVSALKAVLRLPDPQLGGLPLIYHDDPIKSVMQRGPDGIAGTEDDQNFLMPGEEGRAEFLISGEMEGLYPVQLSVSGQINLEGKKLKIDSVGRGQVYVRSADYTLTVEHPDVVSLDEPYEFSMTFHNVGTVPMEDFRISLDPKNLIGTELLDASPSQSLGTLAAGEEKTAVYHMRAKQTGKVVYSYLKAEGSLSTDLNLMIGVGAQGERLTDSVLIFPRHFNEQIPMPLRDHLRRYFKKLWDIAQMRKELLPPGLVALDRSREVRPFLRQMGNVAYEKEAGLSADLANLRLAIEWLRSTNDQPSLDTVRRKILSDGSIPLEHDFGQLLGADHADRNPRELLEAIANMTQKLKGLRVAILDGTPSELHLSDGSGAETRFTGARELPFSSILPLGSERWLIWMAGNQPELSLEVKGASREIHWLYLEQDRRIYSHVDLGGDNEHHFQHRQNEALSWSLAARSSTTLSGIELHEPQAALLFAKQLDPARNKDADVLGRQLMFLFNVPIDLGSLEPLESHFFINDQAVHAIQSPVDQQLLLVAAPMPLGPYKPIRYRIEGLRTQQGALVPRLEGIVTPSLSYFGVTAAGRVVDHERGNLTGARVFLLQNNGKSTGYSGDNLIPLSAGEVQVGQDSFSFPVVQETSLNEKGEYSFDFIALRSQREEKIRTFNRFKIAVLLADGRYRELLFETESAIGAEIRADIAFGLRGKVYGQVLDENHQPIANAPIYVISQSKGLTSAITHSDEQGNYEVENLDMGQILVKSLSGQFLGRASGYLTAENNPLRMDVSILADRAGSMSGRVYSLGENGVEQPIADAWVGLVMDETFEIFQSEWSYNRPYTVGTRTDAEGKYRLEGIKTGRGLLSFYHPNFGTKKRNMDVAAGENPNQDQLMHLAPKGKISGLIVDGAGNPVPKATIRNGSFVTVSNADGSFLMENLYLGNQALKAHKDKLKGEAYFFLDENQPQFENVILTLIAPVRLKLQLVKDDGTPIAFSKINSFPETDSPPSEKTFLKEDESIPYDESPLIYTNQFGRWEGEILGERKVVSEQSASYFNWGFTAGMGLTIAERRYITFPGGGEHSLEIKQRRYFPLEVKVVDGNGNPLIASVYLSSQVPNRGLEKPGIAIGGSEARKTDISGSCRFPLVNEGPVSLVATNPLLGSTQTFHLDWMTPADAAQPILLAFEQQDQARISGKVYDSDGISPAPPGTRVQADFIIGGDRTLTAYDEVDALGHYNFAKTLDSSEAHNVRLTYFHPDSGKFSSETLWLDESLNYTHDAQLLGANRLKVRVLRSDGSPVDAASVEIHYKKLELEYSQLEIKAQIVRQNLLGQIGLTQDFAEFEGVTAGDIQIQANSGLGQVALRTIQLSGDGSTVEVNLRLEATSSIHGIFSNEQGIPLADAEVALFHKQSLLSQILSGNSLENRGGFEFSNLPMRSYRLLGEDPSSARTAEAQVTTTPYDPNPFVELRVNSTIELVGRVDQNGAGISGAEVKLTLPNGKIYITGTDADGNYRYTDLAPGFYGLEVRREGHLRLAQDGVTLENGQNQVIKDIQLAQRADIHLTVLGQDLLPRPHVSVSIVAGDLYGFTVITDAEGKALLPKVLKRGARFSLYDPHTDMRQLERISLSAQEPDSVERTILLKGWCTVYGQVRDGFGAPLRQSVPMYAAGQSFTCDENGAYRISYLPLNNDIEIRALNILNFETAKAKVRLTEHGQELRQDLYFSPSTVAEGQVVDASGIPAANALLTLFRPIFREIRTDQEGRFRIEPALIGETPYKFETHDRDQLKRGTIVIEADQTGQPQALHNLQIVLDPTGFLKGSATYADGKTLSAGLISLRDDTGKEVEQAFIWADGSWHFPRQPLGAYSLLLHETTHEYDAEPVAVRLERDAQVLETNLAMPQDWRVSGRLLSPTDGAPLAQGWVELWRSVDGSMRRLYAGDLNDQGYFDLPRVFDGSYQLKAWSEDNRMIYSGAWEIHADEVRDFPLLYRSSLLGSFVDSRQRPLKGELQLVQNGLTTQLKVGGDGHFIFENLVPGPYLLLAKSQDGWIQLSSQGQLVPGENVQTLVSEESFTLRGQAYLATPGRPLFRAELYLEDIGRVLELDPSGQFEVNGIPVNRPLFLKLFSGPLRKTIPLGSFQQDTDIGSHPFDPIKLDDTPPSVSFSAANQVVTSLPWSPTIQITESDPGSFVDLTTLRIIINGHECTNDFHYENGTLTALYPYFDRKFKRGANWVQVHIANNSNMYAHLQFDFRIEQDGTMVFTQLKAGAMPIAGQVRVDEGEWRETNAEGYLLLEGVGSGSHRIKASSGTQGYRGIFDVESSNLTQELTLGLQSVGEYRGRVLGLDGMGVEGALVSWKKDWELTDSNGGYRFDQLPLQRNSLSASKGSLYGQVEGPSLTLPGQVAPYMDIALQGRGQILGRVVDSEGQPVAGSRLDLNYQIGESYGSTQVSAVTDGQGQFQLDDVLTYPFRIRAWEPLTGRMQVVFGQLAGVSQSLELEIQLQVGAGIRGRMLASDGSPVADLTLLLSDEHFGLRLEAQTDAQGNFQLLGLPSERTLTLKGYLAARGEVFHLPFDLDTSEIRELGDLQMSVNQRPRISMLQMPAVVVPHQTIRGNMAFSDDYGLASYRVAFEGPYRETIGQTFENEPTEFGTSSTFPAAPTAGLLNYSVTIVDFAGLETSETGEIRVEEDLSGPNIQIIQPLAGATFREGDLIRIQGQASDIDGILGVELTYQGQQLASVSRTGTFNFEIFAPDVSEDGEVSFEIQAFDGQNHPSSLPLPLAISARQTEGAPEVLLRSPLEQMPLPLHLEEGLDLLLHADFEDSDGLASYQLRFNGALLSHGLLWGPQAKIQDLIHFDPLADGIESMNLELLVFDIGGNLSRREIQLLNIEGTLISQPLTLSEFDLQYEGQSLILRGGSHQIDGTHSFENLVLVNGATLTQSPTSNDQSKLANTRLLVQDRFVLEGSCAVKMDGTGYPSVPNQLGNVSSGAYAGPGAFNDPSAVYGSFLQPILPGSGRGGGALYLEGREIWLAGSISANPGISNSNLNTYSSGGSIWLVGAQFMGYGPIRANGFSNEQPEYRELSRGSGGRIRIDGTFTGEVEAIGSDFAGSGTLYRHQPDPTQADGYLDVLQLANDHGKNLYATQIPVVTGLVYGRDLRRATVTENGATFEILDLLLSKQPAPQSLLGMRVYREGDEPNGSAVAEQRNGQLRSAPGTSFGNFGEGDLVRIDFEVDRIEVLENALYHPGLHEMREPLRIENAALKLTEPYDFTPARIEARGITSFIGALELGEFDFSGLESLRIDGQLKIGALTLDSGTHELSGRLITPRLTLGANATLQLPFGRQNEVLEIEADQLQIEGRLRATRQQNSGLGSSRSYGGQGRYETPSVYGSLYRPLNSGSTSAVKNAGGALHLSFHDLALNGSIDASADPELTAYAPEGTGGSVLLEGQSLTGSGSIRANAFATSLSGGGRVSLLIEQIGAFQGQIEARGGDSDSPAAAGTIYFRTAEWPDGKLLVQQLGSHPLADAITLLPGLGTRVAAQSTGDGPVLRGSNFPHGLTGLYLQVAGYPPVRIADNTETELYAEAGKNFPPVAAGQSYSGLHILDQLEVRDGARFSSPDPIQLAQPVWISNGSSIIDTQIIQSTAELTFTDDDTELPNLGTLPSLTLVNSHLRIQYPTQFGRIELDSNSTLEIFQPIEVGTLEINGGTLLIQHRGESTSLVAGTVELRNGAAWRVGPSNTSAPAIPLRAEISDALLVDASSSIRVGNSGTESRIGIFWNGNYINEYGNGGFRERAAHDKMFGSFARPELAAKYMAGAIHIRCNQIQLEGEISADWEPGTVVQSGGSIWLEAETISGSGLISARGALASGGGRIAIHYGQDGAFLNSLRTRVDLAGPSSTSSTAAGAGTLFLKAANENYGRLILDQGLTGQPSGSIERRAYLQGITGPAAIRLVLDDANPDPLVVQDPSWTQLPPGLAGLVARVELDGHIYEARIAANKPNQLDLLDPLPAILPAGTQIAFVLKLDQLQLRNGAQLHFAGKVEPAELLTSGSWLNSIWALDLIPPTPDQPFRLQGQRLKLVLEAPDWSTRDLDLIDSELYFDKPIQVRDIQLTRSQIRDSYRYTIDNEPFIPALALEARDIVADSSSGFIARNDTRSGMSSSHGGYDGNQPSYGNLFHPSHDPAERAGDNYLFLKARSLSGGIFDTRSEIHNRPAAAIEIEVQQLSGSLQLHADATHSAAGRIAVSYESLAPGSSIHTDVRSATAYNVNISAGTAFQRGNSDAFGHLTIDNGLNSTKTQPTPIPTLATQTLSNGFELLPESGGSYLLKIPGLVLSENFRDYYLAINALPARTTRILASSNNAGSAEFHLDADPGPLAVGDQIQLALWLDSLTLGPNASLVPANLLLFDLVAPQILMVQSPEQVLPGEAFQVQVQAKDNVALAEMKVTFAGQIQNSLEPNPVNFSLTAPTPSEAGDYEILIEATDRTGNHSSETRSVHVLEVDTVPPSLSFLEPQAGSGIEGLASFTARLSLVDNRALDSVTLEFNGQSYVQSFPIGSTTGSASFPLVTPQVQADQTFILSATATDRVGLSTTELLEIWVQAPDVSNAPLRPSHYWSFDTRDLNGKKPYDLIGGFDANFGNYSGTTVRDSAYGQAATFSNSYRVEVPNIAPVGDGSAFSVATWVKIASFYEGGGILSYGSESNEGWALTTRAVGGNHLRFSVAGSFLESGTLATNTWYYLVATFAQGQASLYLNGQLQSQAQLAVSSAPTLADGWLAMGVYQTGADIGASVSIDDTLIWDAALTATTIADDYQKWLAHQFDFRPPERVANLRVLAQPTAFELSWSASANSALDLLGYLVEIEGLEPFQLAANQTSLLVEGLEALTLYPLRVMALDSNGNRSAPVRIQAATSAAPSEMPQPIAEFSFDTSDKVGNFPIDVQGNLRANNGTFGNLSAGMINQAASYTSATQKTEFVDHPQLDSDAFTLSVWFRPSVNSANGGRLLSYGTRSGERYSLQYLASPGKGLSFQIGSGTQAKTLNSGLRIGNNNRISSELLANEWRHAVVSYENGQARFYINGELWNQADWGAQALPALPSSFLCLGKDTRDSNLLNGSIDQLRIWNRALSAVQIALLSQSEQSLLPLDLRPPEPPTNLRITPTQQSLVLTWSASADSKNDLDQYAIEVDGQPVASLPKTSQSYEIGGLSEESVYQVSIRALDHNGRRSAPLASLAITLGDPMLYPKPRHYWTFDRDDRLNNLPVDQRARALPLFGNIPYNTINLGQSGDAASFTNTSYYGEWLAPKPLLSQRFALSVWVKSTANSFNNNGAWISFGDKYNERFSLSFLPGIAKMLRFQAGDKNGSYRLDFGARMAANDKVDFEISSSDWNHLALSYDQGRLGLYFNGELIDDTLWPEDALPEVAHAFLTLGRRTSGSDNANGYLDELAIWDQALTPERVLLLYQTGHAGNNFKGPQLDFLPPVEITNLKARPGQNALFITWSASSSPTAEIAGYRVYLDQVAVAELGPDQLQVALSDLPDSALYDLRVVVFDHADNESAGLELPVCSLPAEQTNLPGPTSYWSLDSNSKFNNLYRDQIGSNHASYNNVSEQSAAISNEGAYFNSSSHKIEIPKSSSLDSFESFTLFAWVLLKTPRHNAGLITYASETVESFGLSMGIDAGSGNYFKLQSSAAGAPESLSAPVLRAGSDRIYDQINTNRWYQLAASFDHGHVVLYRDGRRIIEGDWNSNALPADDLRKLVLGLYHPGPDVSFLGYLDEVAFFNLALSEAELRVYFLRGSRNEPLWLPSGSKQESSVGFQANSLDPDQQHWFDHKGMQATQLAALFRSQDSFEDRDNILLVGEKLRLSDFHTSKRLWLHNSQVEMVGQLEAESIHLLDGSLLLYSDGSSPSATARLIAQKLELDATSRIQLKGDRASLSIADLHLIAPNRLDEVNPNELELAHLNRLSGLAIDVRLLQVGTRVQHQASSLEQLELLALKTRWIGLQSSTEKPFVIDLTPVEQPVEPSPIRVPEQEDPQPKEAILPKKESRPRNSGQRNPGSGKSGGEGQSPDRAPEPKRESQNLRIKGSRKQSFKHFNKL